MGLKILAPRRYQAVYLSVVTLGSKISFRIKRTQPIAQREWTCSCLEIKKGSSNVGEVLLRGKVTLRDGLTSKDIPSVRNG